MKSFNYIKKLVLVLFVLLSYQGFSQLSKTHFIPPLTFGDFNSGIPADSHIYLSTPSTTNVSYKITAVGQPAVLAQGSDLTNTNSLNFPLGSGNGATIGNLFMLSNQTSMPVNDKGYIIEADSPIYVSVRVNAGSQAGALVSKGHSALGRVFRSGHFTTTNQDGSFLPAYKSFISVMATEDNTQVRFDDLPAGIVIENYTGGVPVNATLNRGESYILAVDGFNSADLIGCLVTSDKDIVVNCGSTVGTFGTGNGRDYGFDQIVDIDKLGNQYIFIRGARPSKGNDRSDDWETVLIVAHEDNTEVFVNGISRGTINAGEYLDIKGDRYDANDNMYVRTTKDVYAYQGVGGLNINGATAEANQGMFLVPALNCETRGNIDNIASIDKIGSDTYRGGLSIVVEQGAMVTFNGRDINDPIFAAQGFVIDGPYTIITQDIPNPPKAYDIYKLRDLSGDIAIATATGGELYVSYFNYSGQATSGAFYSGFTSEPEVVFNLTSNPVGVCVPNVTLEVASPGGFDIFEWYDDNDNDGTFVPTPDRNGIPAVGTTFVPFVEGTYRVKGRFSTCSTKEFDSEPVTVTDCSKDRDIDLDSILNNIDIDNDNDGILNCSESYGDKVIDLLDPTNNTDNNRIAFFGYTYTQDIDSSIGNSTSTPEVVVDNTGVFTSETSAKPDIFTESSTEYKMVFNQALNILINEVPGVTQLAADQLFSIGVPINSNRSVTLLNPSDQLLVDTDLDGTYESGITEFTASEILFKINPAATATDDFEFRSWNTSEFTFKHLNISQTSSNKASFKVSATCLPKDSDNDGINDAIDMDSDNDGIPDYIESLGTGYIPLTTANYTDDANSDGLYDVFNTTSTQNPIDTDTDTVLDYLDLDSDNDGIYDIQESGSTLTDTNFDGITDTVASVGSNGWDDNAETTPDDGLINYTVNDVDVDTFFTYIDLDSDADGCNDVIETGFTDADDDGLLGNSPVTVDALGKVTSASDGYTGANNDYITSASNAITTQPIDENICESQNAIFTVVIPSATSIQWEISTDSGATWVIIDASVTTDEYTGSDTDTLTITNTPIANDGYQYRAFVIAAGNACGVYSDVVGLAVSPFLTITNTINDLPACDDNSNDGFADFNLEIQTPIILSGTTNPSDFTVTYHTSQPNAESGASPILNSDTTPYENTTINSQPIHVRIENNVTACVNTDIVFNIIVYVYPSANPVGNLELCDYDDTIVGVENFDLDSQTNTILGTQLPADFTVTYHTSPSDANTGTDAITNTTAYPNTSSTQTIHVRVQNNTTLCFNDDLSFDIIVNPIPALVKPQPFEACDDDTDGEFTFNTTTLESDMLNGINSADVTVSYFDSTGAPLTDAGGMAITSPFPNSFLSVSQTITAQVESNTFSDAGGPCFSKVEIDFTVNILPVANPVPDQNVCDGDAGDDNTDGLYPFNTSSFEATILGSQTGMNIFYTYIDENGSTVPRATSLPNPLNSGIQSILVEVENALAPSCTDNKNIVLNVNPIPAIIKPATIFEICDDDNDGEFNFSTTTLETDILNGINPADVTISYLNSSGSPLTDANGTPINSPFPANFLTATETINVQVESNVNSGASGPCFNEVEINFIVYAQPFIAGTVTEPAVCDGDAGDDDTDGLYPFDTSAYTSTILGTQTGMTVYYTYEDENGNPVSRTTSLPNPLSSNTQRIEVEIESTANSSCRIPTFFDLEVNRIPQFTIDAEDPICSTVPGASVNLKPILANPLANYTYEWVNIDNTSIILSTDMIYPVTEAGIYKVTLMNTDGSGCSKSEDVEVLASEPANITIADIDIIDISENNTVTITNTNLGLGDYEYALEDSNLERTDEATFNYQDELVFNNVRAGFYKLWIRDKNGCGTSVPLEIPVVGYDKVFTPNNDSVNDLWQIRGVNDIIKPFSTILIYNRYGKLIKQLDSLGEGWDGTFNGKMLPTDDYWFTVNLINGKNFVGHFSLKR